MSFLSSEVFKRQVFACIDRESPSKSVYVYESPLNQGGNSILTHSLEALRTQQHAFTLRVRFTNFVRVR